MVSVEHALQNSNRREQVTPHIKTKEATDAQASNISEDPGVKFTVIEDVDGGDTADRRLRHESISHCRQDLILGSNQQYSPSITDKEEDEQLEDKFEELFEHYASHVMQDPESGSCNNFEEQVEDYCKRAVDDLKVDLAQKETPVAASILSRLQEGTTKIMDMLEKVKGFQLQLKSSVAQSNEPPGTQEKADGKRRRSF